jgi:hypothetical protein
MRTLRFSVIGILLSLGLTALAARLPSNTLAFPTGTRAATVQARLDAQRERVSAHARSVERLRQLLIRHKAISPRMVMPKVDTFIVTGSPTRTRSLPQTRAGGNVLTFAYNGWSTADRNRLQTFLNQAYPVLVNIYGPPASTATLTINAGGFSTSLEGGEFTIDQDTGALSLTVEPLPADFETGDSSHYGNNLLHLVLHAFHAPYLMGYDAWEEGMARAAALVASTLLNPDYDPTYDFSYLLTIYDYLNQPALSNATFFPAQGDWLMGTWRIGMATSAWLKIYAERPYPQTSVFAELNAQYYAAVAANPAVAGNLVSLKSLLASVLPSVEGTPILTWYDRQYVLKPQTVSGSRTFIYELPLQDHVYLLIHYFFTNLDGTERPLTGKAALNYYTYDQIEYFPPEGNEVVIPSDPLQPGVGFISPGFYNIGDPALQRVRILVNVNGLRTTLYYPFGVEGFTFDGSGYVSDVNEFYGAVVGADTGTINIALPGTSLQPNLVQGAFGANLTTSDYGISFFSPVVFSVTANNETTEIRRNVGPGFHVALLRVGDETRVSLIHTFVPGKRMISFPLTPDESDIARMLGYAPGTPVNMAWWNPADGQYHYHPDVPAVQPGRAYWFNPPTTFSPLIIGTQPDINDPRAVTLAPGWNMVGNTFNADLNPWAMVVETNTVAYTFSEAILNGLVEPVWRYGSGGYYEVAPTLSAWEGGWVRNISGVPLTLRQQNASRASVRTAQVDPFRLLTDGGWGVRLQAAAGPARDAMAVFGITPRAKTGVDSLDWQKPPAMGDGIRLAFINPANRMAGAVYATDMRPGIGAAGETWEFEVSCPRTDLVALTWPDLRTLPRGYALFLEDLSSGERRYMRTAPVYSYQATGAPGKPDVRRFRLIAQAQGNTPLSFLDFRIAPVRGKGASVSVRLNATADLRVEVRAPSGRLVRILQANAVMPHEDTVIPWDGRAAGGKLIPAGTYLLTVTARSPEGFVLRRNMAFTMGR